MIKVDLQREAFLDDLMYSSEYAEYIMENADPEYCIVCNGNMLLEKQEEGYLFKEFLESIGLSE